MNTPAQKSPPSPRPARRPPLFVRRKSLRRLGPSLLGGASVAACLLAGAGPAAAVDGTWTLPATGLWSDPLNWSGGTIADGTDGTANFATIDLTADVTVHLDTARTIGNLVFGDLTLGTAGGWIVDDNGSATNVLTLGVTAGAPTITVNALGTAKNVTIQAEVAGSGGLTKAGVGTLVLSGTNTYTGTTTVGAGTLVFGSAAAIGGAGASVLVAANATVALTAGVDQAFLARIDAASAGVIAISAANGNSLDFSGAGANLGSASLGATGAFTYTGTLTPNGTTYRLGGGVGNLTLSNVNALTGANSLAVTNNGAASSIVTLTGANDFSGGTTLTSGILAVNADAALGAAAGGVTFSGSSTLRFTAASTLAATRTLTSNIAVTATLDTGTFAVTAASPLTGAGAFAKAGTGTLTLTGANNYTGGTLINAGTLVFASTAAIAGTGANVLIAANATAASSAAIDQAFLGRIDGTSAGVIALGASSSTNFDFSAGGANLTAASLGATGAFTYTGTLTPNGTTYRLGGGGGNLTLSNVNGLTGGNSLVVTGGGLAASVVTLSAANDFTGGTTINAGILAYSTDAALGAPSAGITFTGASTLRFGAALTLPATRTLTSNAAATATLDLQANAVTVASPLAGAGAFTKIGSGQLTYTGTGSTTGALNVNGGIFRVDPGSSLTVGALNNGATAGVQSVVAGGIFISNALSTINQTGAGFLLSSGSATFNAGIRTSTGSDGSIIRVTGGTFTATDVSVGRDNSSLTTYTSGFIVQGGIVDLQTMGLGVSNSLGHGSFEGGTTTIHGAITIGRQTSVTGGTVRGGAMRVINPSTVFISEETVDGIVIGRTPASIVVAHMQTAEVRFSGGTATAEKFTFQYDSLVRGTGNLLLNGGNLYVGSGGMVKKDATVGQTITVTLTNGLIGAKADWTSDVGAIIGGTAALPLIIKAASAADVAHDITINGAVTGTGGFTKTGAGTLTITGNSTFTGGAVGTTISAGTIQVGNGGTTGALGTAANAVINNATLAFNRSNAFTFANNISGSGALQQNGTGTTTLSGTNTYSGNTTINAGTLRVTSSLPSPVVTVNSTGTLAGNATLAGAVTVNSGGRLAPSDATGANPATLTLASVTLTSGSTLDVDFTSLSTFDKVVVTGTNGLTIDGTSVNLYANATVNPWITTGSYNLFQYTGALGGLAGTNLNAALTVANPQGGRTYNFTSGGGFITLVITDPNIVPTWIATGGGSWNTAGNWNTTVPNAVDVTAKFNSAITTPSTVTLDGNKTVGTIEFGNANAYTIAQGTSGTLTLSKTSGSAALDVVTGSHTISAPVGLASPTLATIFDAVDTLTVSGAVSGASSLTKSGLGTLVLSSANSFGGGATLTAGTLRIGHNQSLGTAALSVTGNGTLQFGANNLTVANDVAVDPGVTATIDTAGNAATLSGVVSGDGGLSKAGSGRLVLLSDVNSYNGPTTITAGTLSVANLYDGSLSSPLGQSANAAASLVLNGGTLEFTGAGSFTDRLFRLGTAGGEIAASGTAALQFTNFGAITLAGTNTARTLTLSGTNTDLNSLSAVIGNNGTGATSLTKSGPGTWGLFGANTFTGQTQITGGILQLGNAGALAGSTLNYDNLGGTLDDSLIFLTLTLGGLSGAQTLPLTNAPALFIGGNGQSTTYSGSLSAAAALTKNGAGTLTLSGTNTLAGIVTIAGGTLEVATGGTLSTPTITLTATATLFRQTGGTVTAGLLDLENNSAQQLRATFEAGSTATFTTTTLGATNATSAPCVLTINGGTIALGNYISQRDGGPNFNTTAGLIIHGGTVTATSVQVSTAASWSNVTLTGGSLEIGTMASDGAFFLGGGTNNGRGGNLTMSGGTLTYQGIDGLVLNRSTGNSIGQATFSGGTANLTGLTLNAATATGGNSALTISGATVYLGAVGLDANTSVATATATLNGGILAASADWTGTANLTLGVNGITVQAADAASAMHDITLSGTISGPGTLTKTGNGTLTVTGAQNYSALTTSAGITDVNGAFTGGTATVNANAATNFGASQTLAALNIGAGAVVTLTASAPFAPLAGPGVSVVPEPSAIALLLTGALGLLKRRRRA